MLHPVSVAIVTAFQLSSHHELFKYKMYDSLMPYTLSNLQEYARHNDYGFHMLNEDLFRDRKSSWVEIDALRHYLHLYDWVFWTDVDFMFVTKDPLPLTGDMVVSHECIPGNEWKLMSGNLLLRRSKWAFQFLDEWDAMYEEYKNVMNHDQIAFETLVKKHKKHITVLPPQDFMTYDTHDCVPPTFGIHFPGPNKYKRVKKWLDKVYTNPSRVGHYYQVPTYFDWREDYPIVPANISTNSLLMHNKVILAKGNTTMAQIRQAWSPSISIVIPAIRDDVPKIPQLKKSIQAQTIQPDEVIYVVSGACPEVAEWIVICSPTPLKAGSARNIGWNRSNSDIVSFFDADDLMYPERTEVILRHFENMEMVLHEFSKTPIHLHKQNMHPDFEDNVHEYMLKTEGKQLHLHTEMTHGHVSVRRNINCPPFVDDWAEDSIFVRQCVKRLGPGTQRFIRHPLSRYVPR